MKHYFKLDEYAVIPNLNLTPSTNPIPSEVLKWQQKCKRLENASTELRIIQFIK